jgi:hypothetical protein
LPWQIAISHSEGEKMFQRGGGSQHFLPSAFRSKLPAQQKYHASVAVSLCRDLKPENIMYDSN